MLSIFGMVWISVVFSESDKISEQFSLEPSNSHKIKLYLAGEDIGFYRIFIPEFSGEEIFVQILDANSNVISEQVVQTKMSVGYFDFEKNGNYSLKIANISKNSINLQVEFGNTNSQNMIPAGIIVLVGAVIIIISAYLKLKNYRIEHPDENIS